MKSMYERLRDLRIPIALNLGTVALCAGVYAYDEIPRYGHITPAVASVREADILPPRIITSNAHFELPDRLDDFAEMVEKEQPSIMAVQEAGADAVESIGATLTGWNILHGQADAKVRLVGGGIGNMVMSRMDFYDERTHKIDEPGLIEDRIVMSAKTHVIVEGVKEEVQIISYHISRHAGYREEEFGRLLKIIEGLVDDADSTIACGDSNTNAFDTQVNFGAIKFEAKTSTHPTYIGTGFGSIVDSCAFYTRGRVGFKRAERSPYFNTDHKPVMYDLIRLSGVYQYKNVGNP